MDSRNTFDELLRAAREGRITEAEIEELLRFEEEFAAGGDPAAEKKLHLPPGTLDHGCSDRGITPFEIYKQRVLARVFDAHKPAAVPRPQQRTAFRTDLAPATSLWTWFKRKKAIGLAAGATLLFGSFFGFRAHAQEVGRQRPNETYAQFLDRLKSSSSLTAWFFRDEIKDLWEELQSEENLVLATKYREKADERPADVEASAVDREKLRDALKEPEAQDQERQRIQKSNRMYALTALAGCGTQNELAPLYRVALDETRSSEERRLSLRAVESILRRSIACGFLPQVDFTALDEFVSTVFLRIKPKQWDGSEADLADLSRAGAIFARKSNHAEQYRQLLGRIDVSRLTPIGTAYLFSAAQMPEAAELIRKLAPEHYRYNAWTEQIGRMCGLVGDDALIVEMRALFVNETRGQSRIEGFEAGLQNAELEVVGIRRELEHPLGKSATRLRRVFAGTTVEENPNESGEPGAASRKLDRNVLAKWFFGGDEKTDVRASGPGLIQDMNAGVVEEDIRVSLSDSPDDSRAKFVAPGTSTLTFRFRVEKQEPLEVVVEHIKRSNQMWPYDGAAKVSVAFDGKPFYREFEVPDRTWVPQAFRISEQYAEPGEHVVSIRLTARSSAAYSIRSVRIRTR